MNRIGTERREVAGGYGLRHAARMEWIKLRSLRSSGWALAMSIAGMVGIGIVTAAFTEAPVGLDAQQAFDPTNNLLAGMLLGQLLVGVLGVLTMTSEYSSGAIRATLAAVPRRPLLLAAKAAVFGAVTLAACELAVFAAFLAGRAVLTDAVAAPSLGDPGVLRALVLSGVYLAQVGLIGLGLGALIRHSASAIGTLFVVMYVVPAVTGGLTGTAFAKYLPTMIAGNSIAVARTEPEFLSPATGFALLCAYTAAALLCGGWMLARRDA